MKQIQRAIVELASRCPRLAKTCFWAGTAAVSIEELGHRESYDIDLHTVQALIDVRPLLAELQDGFAGDFEIHQAPDSLGSRFSGILHWPEGADPIPLQVLSSYESAAEGDLVASQVAPGLRRVGLRRYLADKIQCVVERTEARDLFDIEALLRHRDGVLQPLARRLVAGQDAVLLAERLTGWSEAAIRADLEAHPDIDPGAALDARDRLLAWLRATDPPLEDPD